MERRWILLPRADIGVEIGRHGDGARKRNKPRSSTSSSEYTSASKNAEAVHRVPLVVVVILKDRLDRRIAE